MTELSSNLSRVTQRTARTRGRGLGRTRRIPLLPMVPSIYQGPHSTIHRGTVKSLLCRMRRPMTRVRAVLLITLAAVILAVFAVIPNPRSYDHLRALRNGCDYGALSVQPDYAAPGNLPYRYWWVYDGTAKPIGTVTARSADAALTIVQRQWSDSYGEVC